MPFAWRIFSGHASVSVETLVAEFLDSRRAKAKSETYIRDLEKRLARFAREIGLERMVSDIQAAEVDAWIHGSGVGPQTMNNFRAVLSAAWGFAVKRGYASENILGCVDKVKVTRDHVASFTAAEIEKLLNAAPFEFIPFLAIGAFAGLRPEEIKRLQWAEVSFEDRLITVNASVSKTAKKRFAEISPNLLEWLKPFAGRTGAVACPNLQKFMRQTRRDAGIATWPADVLRHTFASNHYAHHKNPAHTALLLGHRNQDMLLNLRTLQAGLRRKWRPLLPMHGYAGRALQYVSGHGNQSKARVGNQGRDPQTAGQGRFCRFNYDRGCVAGKHGAIFTDF